MADIISNDPLLVDVKEARRLLTVGNSKLYDLIKEKRLTAVKLGRSTRITVASIRTLAAGGENAR